ncbi:galanin receptor type 2-like [Babylonia areolata]|uniref:galanin receptor type 2-like n=1 Tax=Babylonia areolata TaxID=304850 RepID=UPI003FCFD4B4
MASPPTPTPPPPNDTWSFNSSDADNNNVTQATRPPINIDDIFLIILKTFPDYRDSLALGRYGCAVQVGVGTVTNLLTVMVMTRRSLLTSTTCFYFALLAVADLFVLYFSCLRRLLYVINDNDDVFVQHDWACHLLNFLAYFSYDFSSWVLTVMTIDRYIAIRFPLRSAAICTIRNACFAVVGVVLLCTAKNCHFFFTFEKTPRSGCLGLDAHADFLDEVWPWIDAALYSFLPFFLLFLFNILIIHRHRQALKQQRSLHAATNGARVNRFNQRLTTMLLVVSFTFMLMTAPKVVLFCIRREVFKLVTPEGRINFPVIAQYSLISAIFDFLMWTNHTINFFLYCLSGTRFRQELLRMLSQWFLYLRCNCKQHARVSASNQCGAHKHVTHTRGRQPSERRGSSTSVISDDVAPAPAQLPQETEDALTRVTRWATVTFVETQQGQGQQ